MLTTERELVAAIYLLYLSECIHWLKQGQTAMTLRLDGTWKSHRATEDSYALAGRTPVFVNPIDLRASYMGIHAGQLPSIIDTTTGRLVSEKLPDMGLLTAFAVLGALNLLIVLPFLLLSGFLGPWWRVVIALLVFTQIGTAMEVFLDAGPWRAADPRGFRREFVALLLNPVAALRSGDILLAGLTRTLDADGGESAEEPTPSTY